MNRTEAALLLRKVIAYCPAQTIDELTPDAWAEVLDTIRYIDANQAVKNLGGAPLDPGRSRYIEVGHVIGEVKRIRARRCQAADHPIPPYGLTQPEELAWVRRAWDSIADGEPVPDRPALTQREMPGMDLTGRIA